MRLIAKIAINLCHWKVQPDTNANTYKYSTCISKRLSDNLDTIISTAAFNELEHFIYIDMYQKVGKSHNKFISALKECLCQKWCA